jgi:hypothetical protein
MPRSAVQREWDANTKRERCREGGMQIPKKGGCRYEERRDADAEGCNTQRPGMEISRGSDADAE